MNVRALSMLLILCTALSSGCRTVPPAVTTGVAFACAADERAMVRETLYFGRNLPGGGTVSDVDWQRFVDDALTPRFPDGFTLVPASGQWRAGDGAIERESTMLFVVLHDGDAAASRAVGEIADDYKRRFRQQAVLRERSSACVRF